MPTEPSSFGQAISGRILRGAEAAELRASHVGVPLFYAAWLFAAGIAFSHWVWTRPNFVLMGLAMAAALCVLAALRAQRIAWLPLALLWSLLGAWCAQVEPQPSPGAALDAMSDGLTRTIEGTVIGAETIRGEGEASVDDPAGDGPLQSPTQRIDLSVSTVERVTDDVDVQAPVSGNVRLTIRWPLAQPGSSAPALRPLHCGEHVRAPVRLLRPETFHDPGAFSRENYLLDQGITSVATVNEFQVEKMTEAAVPLLACRLSAWQHASTARLLSLPQAMRSLPALLRITPADAAMLAAMVAGDRTYLSHSLRAGFERTGSFHMLVVSGFHLAIVAGCIFFVARRLRIPQVPATLLTIAASFAYALFTGFATPVQRSLWMVTLYLLARLVYRERSPLNTIGFAALCLLAASPRSLFDAGLQMTLLAVIAIAGIALPLLEATVHPYFRAARDLRLLAIDAGLPPSLAQFRVTLRMLADAAQSLARAFLLPTSDDAPPGRWSSRVPGYCWRAIPFAAQCLLRAVELIAVSCIVELAMTLPMALYFHRITLFALPVNLLILPLLALLMPAALLTLIASFVHPAAAIIPAMLTAMLLHVGVWIVHLFGSLTFGDFRIPAPALAQSAVFCALMAAAMLLVRGGRWPRRAACCAILLAALAAVAPQPIEHPRGALLVEAIDVGQGDSLLLVTPDGKTLLIDAGGFGGGPHQAPQDFDMGEEVVSAALWARGIRHLDAVALTHAHSDHMGGMPAVLRNFHPAELWVGNNPHFAAYESLLAEAASLHIAVRSFRAGDCLAFGQVQIAVLAPLRNYQPGPEPANNDSLVMHAAYGGTSVLLEGDAEAPIEQAMLNEAGLQSTLLKVGHHGSLTSTRPEFLARVSPQWAVISCGLHNRYHHPRPEVLKELEEAHVRTYATDLNGAVCFRLDGKTVQADAACGWRASP